jgi:phenylalanyl-tRNA synthetase beta chain
MRPSLVPGFIRAAAFNFNRESKRVQFFEIGNVFKRSNQGTYHIGIAEETHILFGCGGEAISASWNRNAIAFSVFDIKGSLDRLLEDLRIAHLITVESNDDTRLVYKSGPTVLGEVLVLPGNQKKLFDTNESLFCAEFSLTKLQGLVENLDALTYTPIPKFPGIEYDFALIVEQSVAAGDMMNVIRQYGTNRLNHIHVFDLFEGKTLGEGKKSIAFRLNFVDDSKTLTIKDVDSIIGKIVNRLEQQFGAKLRS